MYHLFYIELALKDPEDSNVYAFENVSHIPTKKLAEIFEINFEDDPLILQGYMLTPDKFDKHRDYLLEHLGQMNLDIFQYSLQHYSIDDLTGIRKLYKESLME